MNMIYSSCKILGGLLTVARENVILVCTECGEENYITTRNKRKHPEKLEVKKYCPRLRKMTLHKEKK